MERPSRRAAHHSGALAEPVWATRIDALSTGIAVHCLHDCRPNWQRFGHMGVLIVRHYPIYDVMYWTKQTMDRCSLFAAPNHYKRRPTSLWSIWPFATLWWWPRHRFSSTTHSIGDTRWVPHFVRRSRSSVRCLASGLPLRTRALLMIGGTGVHEMCNIIAICGLSIHLGTTWLQIRWAESWRKSRHCSSLCWSGATRFLGPCFRCCRFGDALCPVSKVAFLFYYIVLYVSFFIQFVSCLFFYIWWVWLVGACV